MTSACSFVLLQEERIIPPLIATLQSFAEAQPEVATLASDWRFISNPDYISEAVIEEDEIWAVTTKRLLRWSRQKEMLQEYEVGQVPLLGTKLYDLVAIGDDLLISGDMGLTIFDQNEEWSLIPAETTGINFSDYVGETNWDDAITISPQGEIWVSTFSGLATFSGDVDLAPGGELLLTPNASAPDVDIRQVIE